MTYIYTLDSHDCYGPFQSQVEAFEWAQLEDFGSYQLLPKPPFENTVVLHPFDVYLFGREV